MIDSFLRVVHLNFVYHCWKARFWNEKWLVIIFPDSVSFVIQSFVFLLAVVFVEYLLETFLVYLSLFQWFSGNFLFFYFFISSWICVSLLVMLFIFASFLFAFAIHLWWFHWHDFWRSFPFQLFLLDVILIALEKIFVKLRCFSFLHFGSVFHALLVILFDFQLVLQYLFAFLPLLCLHITMKLISIVMGLKI